jgi:uncharacterized protein (DUF983 family)
MGSLESTQMQVESAHTAASVVAAAVGSSGGCPPCYLCATFSGTIGVRGGIEICGACRAFYVRPAPAADGPDSSEDAPAESTG